MKITISIISIFILSTNLFGGIFDEVVNPNGKPFLLSIRLEQKLTDSFRYSDNSYRKGHEYYTWEFKLPVTNYLTVNLELPTFEHGEIFEYCFGPENCGDDDVQDLDQYVKIHKRTIGVELHLPIYKLWDK